ncbi:alpha/beta fold hydrolase [Cellulomonas sp. KRMCY2]|uniref:alpha/beta fold hydrolase n=1 Tax=Cellulomonas sp. KRMCY2 TaxID=1304865 RepID=UPI00045EBE59|nr:alpha/beta fold hydrolase [Cellulomonas sp. KRMCY2]
MLSICSGRTGRVAWDLHGDGPGVPVLALHGVTDSAECWRPVLPWLADGRAVLAVDARGHGRSDLPAEPFTIAALAADAAAAVRDAVGRPVVVVGHSMGGLVAQELALTAPELVAAVVLEEPAWNRAREVDDAGVPRWLRGTLRSFVGRTQAELEERSQRENPGWPADEHGPWTSSKRQVDQGLADVPHDWAGRVWSEAVGQIGVPVTLLTGEPARGAIVDAQHVERAHELLGPLLTHVPLIGVGHNVRREGRAMFVAAVRRVVSAADSAAG